ncbi:MAG: hypothetical protein LBR66_04900 [Candidatus Symbiothrix sp.]|nr:hypothetical protein [Candidatus Symbiothrix sp.]
MNRNKMNLLLEKYFEGQTSLSEEERLRSYFESESVPPEWQPYQALFQYFASERVQEKPATEPVRRHNTRRLLLRWGSLAAACLLLFVCLRHRTIPENKSAPEISIAYIDGKQCADIKIISEEALKGLENFSEINHEVYSSQIEALDFFINQE